MSRVYNYGAYRQPAFSMPKATGLLQKYPEDIQCVYPSADPAKGAIYVSNVEAASNHLTLAKFNIRAVMTCAKGYDHGVPKSKLDMFEYYPFDDKETCVIAPHFDSACDFIAAALAKTNILVHCIAGVSRSVSMVLAYLIRDKGMTYDEAYHAVKARRSIISPNDGFIRQLKEYAQQIRQRMRSPGHKTPPKEPMREKEERVYKTTIKKTDTYYRKTDSILNEQDLPASQVKNDSWYNLSNKSSLNQTKDSLYSKNASMVLPRASTAGLERPRTPEKVGRSTEEGSLLEGKPRTEYFRQMNEELNEKIQAIHLKYEKEREALLAKRTALSTALGTRDARALSSKSPVYAQNRYSSYVASEVEARRERAKYANLYDSKYSRGLGLYGGRYF